MSRRLRIALVAPRIGNAASGVGTFVESMSGRLCAAGHNVTIVAGEASGVGGHASSDPGTGSLDLQTTGMPFPWNQRLLRSPRMRTFLRERIRGFDVVDIQGIWSVVAVEAARACIEAGVPYIITPHGMMADWDWMKGPKMKRLFFSTMLKPVWRQAAAIRLFSSSEIKNLVVPPLGKSVVVPNFVIAPPAIDRKRAEANMRKQFSIPPDAMVILFLGRVTDEKGVLELLAVFERVAQKRRDAMLLLVGPFDGRYGELVREKAASLRCAGKVRLSGPLYGEDKYTALCSASLFVTLSKSEGMPLAVLEALASRLPVVITERSHLPEIVAYDAGLLAVPCPDQSSEAILQLLADSDRLRRTGANARRLFTDHFTSEIVIPKIVSLYESVLNGAARESAVNGASWQPSLIPEGGPED